MKKVIFLFNEYSTVKTDFLMNREFGKKK